MTDGFGSKSYNYNQLSQMTSETRTFNGVGTFPLNYDYNLAGELKKITDATNMTINYGYDSTGRLNGVTGADSLYAGVANYASNFQYRAWGDLKHMQYGNALTLDQQFNSRLQVTSFQIPGLMAKTYDYYSDGRVNHSFNDAANNKFDRSYTYDHAGRVSQALSGPAARGEADTINRPYLQSYTYDGFSHLTGRTGRWWLGIGGQMSGQQYQNERNTAWAYDADGRLMDDANVQYSYDAAGRAIHGVSTGQSDLTQSFDGDGERAKSVEVTTIDNGDGTTSSVTTTRYYLRSSVQKEVIMDLDQAGVKQRGFVYQGSAVLAWQEKVNNVATVEWEHREPSNASFRMTTATGYADTDRSAELDPTGADRGVSDPFQFPRPQPQSEGLYPAFDSGAGSGATQCRLDGLNMPCDVVIRFFRTGAGNIRPVDDGQVRDLQQRHDETFNKAVDELNDYWRSLPWRTEYSAPQNPLTQDNPKRIDAPSSRDCNLSVSFSGSFTNSLGQSLPNGPGDVSTKIGNVHGLGFTVTGSVSSDGIGRIGWDKNPSNPRGSWTLEQWIWNYNVTNGNVVANDTRAIQEAGTDLAYKTSGNTFGWWDFPSAQTQGLTSYYRKINLAVKVMKGNTQCEVKFHVLMTSNNGGWSIGWGRGNY